MLNWVTLESLLEAREPPKFYSSYNGYEKYRVWISTVQCTDLPKQKFKYTCFAMNILNFVQGKVIRYCYINFYEIE